MIHFTAQDRFIVTGSSSGIGRSVAALLLQLGASIIAVGRRRAALEELASQSPEADRVLIVERDLVADIEKLAPWVVEVSKGYGPLRGMVLSAGEQQIQPVRSISLQKARDLFELNYFSTVALCQGFCDRRSSRAPSTSIVLLSSIAATAGTAGIANYGASKAALLGFMRSFAVEVAKDAIRVNAVLPGFVRTGIVDRWSDVYTEEFQRSLADTYPLGLGRPEDIAPLIAFLLSERSRWITGASYVVDGGASL